MKRVLHFILIVSFLYNVPALAQEDSDLAALVASYPKLNKLSDAFASRGIGLNEVIAYCRKNPELSNETKSSIIEAAYWEAKNNDRKGISRNHWADIRYNMDYFIENVMMVKEKESTLFLDLGCGTGQKVFASLCLGFEKATGLEYSAEFEKNARDYLAPVIGAGLATIVRGDALKAELALYQQANFIYMYSPMKEDEDMAKFYFRAVDNMNENTIVLEVRMVYIEALRQLFSYDFPTQENGFFAVKKMNGKYYYKNADNSFDWKELRPLK